MRLQQIGIVGEFGHVVAVGMTVAEQHMHQSTGKRRIRARLGPEMNVRLSRRRRAIGVDDDELRAALFARAGNVGHQIDLGVDRVGTPDDDQIRLGEFPRIAAALGADARGHPGQHDRRTDRVVLARIAHGVAQALNAVALHLTHGARIVIQPDRFGPMFLCGGDKFFGDDIERIIPRDRLEIGHC